MITGNIDLSIGSLVGMCAMISATLMANGINPAVAIFVAFLGAMAVGAINGFLVGKYKLPPFIATLGTMFGARGVAYMVNDNRNTDAISSGIGKKQRIILSRLCIMGKRSAFTIHFGLR